MKAIKPETIANGFRTTGVCPLNSSAIKIPDSSLLDEEAPNNKALNDEVPNDEIPNNEIPNNEAPIDLQPTSNDSIVGDECVNDHQAKTSGDNHALSEDQVALFEKR